MTQCMGKISTYKEVIKIIDNNNQIMEMYSNHDGNEVKVMSVEMAKQE